VISTITTSAASSTTVSEPARELDAGYGRHDIGQAFDMLYIERSPNIDAGIEQFFHIPIAFGMTALRRDWWASSSTTMSLPGHRASRSNPAAYGRDS
jgi:hypothetical protein